MGFGVGARFEYLGAEFVSHEDVVVQVDAHAARAAGHPIAHLKHLGAVGGEMQVEPQIPHARTPTSTWPVSGIGSGTSSR